MKSRPDTANVTGEAAEFGIGGSHPLWPVEKAGRMAKPVLQARPAYHHTRDSIEAHRSMVFAVMVVSPMASGVVPTFEI